MKGIKTYLVGITLISWGTVGCFSLVPANIWQGISLALIGFGFVFLRWGLRNSWSGAYKVYVKEKDGGKIFTSVLPAIRGEI
jgi:hypothetical protein